MLATVSRLEDMTVGRQCNSIFENTGNKDAITQYKFSFLGTQEPDAQKQRQRSIEQLRSFFSQKKKQEGMVAAGKMAWKQLRKTKGSSYEVCNPSRKVLGSSEQLRVVVEVENGDEEIEKRSREKGLKLSVTENGKERVSSMQQ